MDERYETAWEVPSSMCDYTGRLGVTDTFNLFMDLATVHALQMGCGFSDMAKRNLFWLTVKTKIVFAPVEERPWMGETVTASTWPEAPDRMRCVRSYRLERDGKVVAAGKTEWAILNRETGGLAPMAGVYPEGLEFPFGTAVDAPFVRVVDAFADVEPYATYRVTSADIDLGHHMNNVAYVRALLGSFTVAQLKAMDIREIDAIFRNQCFEGDELVLQRKVVPDGLDVRLSHDGKPMFLAHIVCTWEA